MLQLLLQFPVGALSKHHPLWSFLSFSSVRLIPASSCGVATPRTPTSAKQRKGLRWTGPCVHQERWERVLRGPARSRVFVCTCVQLGMFPLKSRQTRGELVSRTWGLLRCESDSNASDIEQHERRRQRPGLVCPAWQVCKICRLPCASWWFFAVELKMGKFPLTYDFREVRSCVCLSDVVVMLTGLPGAGAAGGSEVLEMTAKPTAALRERMDVGVECQPERANVTAQTGCEERRAHLRRCICRLGGSQGRHEELCRDLFPVTVALLWRSRCAHSGSELQVLWSLLKMFGFPGLWMQWLRGRGRCRCLERFFCKTQWMTSFMW